LFSVCEVKRDRQQVKMIKAPDREEHTIVRKGLRLLEGRTEIAVRKSDSNASTHLANTRHALGDAARMSPHCRQGVGSTP